MNISFFTPRNYLGCIIRGKQMADYLGGKYNPPNGYENDLCIYVKPRTLDRIRDCDWVDISDGEYVIDLLKSRPKIKVITHSLYTHELLKSWLPNEIVWISQQHLNWERARRERKEINTCGYIGGPNQKIRNQYEEIGKRLNEIGFNFITCFDFTTRESCIEFFKKIDILVIGPTKDTSIYKTPTKIINAASFGIPSVAYPLKGYKEWEGNYIKAESLDQMLDEVKKLRDSYREWSEKIIEPTEYYHISNVAKRYEALNNYPDI